MNSGTKKTLSMDKPQEQSDIRQSSTMTPDKTDTTVATEPLQIIDLSAIIRGRVKGWKGRLIPSFLLHALERVIRQRELNDMLRYAYPERGSLFARAILRHLDITLHICGLEDLPDDEPLVFASNHPLGGLDGIALVAVLGEKFGDRNIAVLVNDMLMNVAPLRDVFLPVNKYGRQQRAAAENINEAFRQGRHMVYFPAGLVSRLHDDGTIADLEWHKAFVAKALEFNRRIIPIRFEALNTMTFYRMARLRKKIGLKINIEQALLPSELVKCRGKKFHITFGAPIDPAIEAKKGSTPIQTAAKIRRRTI